MKSLLFIIVCFFTFTLTAQDAPQVEVHSSSLQQGEMLVFGERSIRFKEVVSDSRCPKEVTCVWAGEAKVLVGIYENGDLLEEKILTVNAGNIPLAYSVENVVYNITGLMLSPYPTVETKNTTPHYTLQLKVSEKTL